MVEAAQGEATRNPIADLSARLVDAHYIQLGCDDWNRPRFHRLCAKLQRTPREMSALLRITPRELERRIEEGFTKQDGLILMLLDREIDVIHSGQPPTKGVFVIVNLTTGGPS